MPSSAACPSASWQAAQARAAIEDEGWRLRKDGTRFWANVVITALRDRAGDLIGFAKVTRDLTRAAQDRGAPARTARSASALLVQSVRTTRSSCSIPTATSRPGTRARSSIKGYAAAEIIGRHFSLFYPARGDRSAAGPRTSCKTATTRGPLRGRGLARAQGRLALLGQRRHHGAARRARAGCSASPRSRATSPSAAATRRSCAQSEETLSPAGRGRDGLRHLHARPRRHRHAAGTPAPHAHQWLRGQRNHRQAFFALLSAPTTSAPTSRGRT